MKRVFANLAFVLLTMLPALGANPGVLERHPASAPELERNIRQELLLLPGYTVFDNIDFEVKGATVRLTGEVTQSALKGAAEQAVKELPGVRHVVNNIEVLPSSSLDDEIRMAAFRAIYSEPALRSYTSQSVQPIRILVKNGCLIVEGTVASEADRDAVYRQMLSVPGVLAVSNHLRVLS